MDILDFLRSDGSIVVNKKLAHEIGLNEAVVYSELVSLLKYWDNRGQLTEDGFFFCTLDNLQENTAIKSKTLQRTTAQLVKLGLIEKKSMGLPARTYYRITNGIYGLLLDVETKNGQNGRSRNGAGSTVQNTGESRSVQNGQNVSSGEDKLTKQDETNCPRNNTKTNNTELITDDDENKEARACTREQLTQLTDEHPRLKPLFDYLKGEMLDPYIVKDILTEMLGNGLPQYRTDDARNQLDYMKDEITSGKSYTHFGRYFVNGLIRRSKTSLDVDRANNSHKQDNDLSVYFNWLDGE